MDSSTSNTCSNDDDKKHWETELDAVRQYLLSNDNPFPSTHIGIIAALNGIEMEMKRRLRDTKLQQKFILSQSKSTSTTTTTTTTTTLEGDYYEIDVTKIDTNTNNTTTTSPGTVVLSLPPPPTSHDNNGGNSFIKISTMMTDDWEDVTDVDVMVTTTTNTLDHTNDNDTDMMTEHTTTTRSSSNHHNADEIMNITKYVISTLAEQKILCRHPISALAVVLHIVLLQSNNNHHTFICTGIPDDDATNNNNNNGGFAPPIRDLPVGQLLPLHWDDDRVTTTSTSTNQIRFRYRKIGYGTFILSVIKEDNTKEPIICITLESNQKSDTETQNPLRITITDHINLLSWDTAKKSSSSSGMKISPVLHYKGLGIFVRQFMEHFHLSTTTTKNNESHHHVPSSNDHFASHYANAGAIKDIPTLKRTIIQPTCGGDSTVPSYQSFVLPNVLTATTGLSSSTSSNHQFYSTGGPLPIHGQFDGDLYPSGGIPAPFPHGSGMGLPGNLMGPNHPIFNTRYGDDDNMNNNNTFGIHDGMMKPRFDPFGPPGGPTELPNHHHHSNNKLPGGTGNPNNDLGIPPSLNNNNMFL